VSNGHGRSPADVAAELRLVVARLARRLRQEALTGLDLPPARLSTLAAIVQKGPATLTEIAAAEQVRLATVARTVQTLVEIGLVARETSPDDGRAVRVTATNAGRQVVAASHTRKDAYLARRVAGLSVRELRTLERALPALHKIIDGEVDETIGQH
jgi:DNA-binding MarR family transcriptional regulator